MTFIWNSWRAPQTVVVSQVWKRPPTRGVTVNIASNQPVLAGDGSDRNGTVLLVDPAASPQAVLATVRQIQQQQDSSVSILLPKARWVSSSTAGQRWIDFALRTGTPITNPGDEGWFRIDTSDMGGKLDEQFLPAELLHADKIIAFPEFPNGNPFDFWRQFVHPHTRLRSEASQYRSQLAVELSAAVRTDYVFRTTGKHLSGQSASQLDGKSERLTISSNDAVATRLIWLCAQQFFTERDNTELVNPWEDKQIQAAADLAIGVPVGTALSLQVHSATNMARSFAQFVADKLDCLLIQLNESKRG